MNRLERAELSTRWVAQVDAAVSNVVDKILGHIWYLDDEAIYQVAVALTRLESAVFVVRGACAYVLRNRYKARLEKNGPGLKDQMRALAGRWNISVETLYKDLAIFEQLALPDRLEDPGEQSVDEAEAEIEGVLREPPARYIAECCLKAPDPNAVLAMMEHKRKTGPYPRNQAVADVEALRESDRLQREGLFPRETIETLRESTLLNIKLGGDDKVTLEAAARRADCSANELILRCIRQGDFLSDAATDTLSAMMSFDERRGIRLDRSRYLEKLIAHMERGYCQSGRMEATSLTRKRLKVRGAGGV